MSSSVKCLDMLEENLTMGTGQRVGPVVGSVIFSPFLNIGETFAFLSCGDGLAINVAMFKHLFL